MSEEKIDLEFQKRSEACDQVEARIKEYVDEYEFDDGESSHMPTELESFLIYDAIHGLLADDEFIAKFTGWKALCVDRQAALQESEAGAVGYIDEEGIFISVKAYNKVINVFKCLYTPVFLAPPSAQAIETAAIMKCVEVVRSLGEVKDSAYVEAFLALITQDGRTQLEQKCMEAQERTEKCIRDYFAFKSSMHPAQMQDLINELRRMAESTKGEK